MLEKIIPCEIKNFSTCKHKESDMLIDKPKLDNIRNNKVNVGPINRIMKEEFELVKKIGSGCESEVYHIINKKRKINLALKKIKPKNGKINPVELYISKTLKYKNIIQVYHIYKDIEQNSDYVLMEHGTYGNLIDFQHKFLKNNYFTESLLNFIVYQILQALNYCHKCHVLHLDLKPQNIIIDEYLNVKLIDFSISLKYNFIKSEKVEMKPCGTTFFIAPEVHKSKTIEKKDLNKIDLYSLGVIIYLFAFGEFPFGLDKKTKDFDKIIETIDNNDLKINNEDNNYSTYFIDFLKKLLEKDINKRISIDESLNHYWVKGAEIIMREKEKIYNAGSFLGYLITDHFINFNQYLNGDIEKLQCF